MLWIDPTGNIHTVQDNPGESQAGRPLSATTVFVTGHPPSFVGNDQFTVKLPLAVLHDTTCGALGGVTAEIATVTGVEPLEGPTAFIAATLTV
jgi:hypothetical protein